MNSSPARSKTITLSSSFLSDTYAWQNQRRKAAICERYLTGDAESQWYLSSSQFIAESNSLRYRYRRSWSSTRLNCRRAWANELPFPSLGKSIHLNDQHQFWILDSLKIINRLRMPKLISFKIQVSFTPKAMDDESTPWAGRFARVERYGKPDHFVQSEPTVDDWCESAQIGHEVIFWSALTYHADGIIRLPTHFFIHEPKR
jgi:hypothetical protein